MSSLIADEYATPPQHEILTELPLGARVVEAVPEDVRAVAQKIRTDRCILFVGAGVHAAPPADSRWKYSESQRPMRGGELATHLAEQSDYSDHYPDETARNLGRIALYCDIHRNYGREWLVREVRRKVHSGKRPSPAVRALAELDLAFFATTNYDQLLEDALRSHHKRPCVSTYHKDSKAQTDDYVGDKTDPTPEEPFLLKFHGDIDQPESLVITDEDYIDFLLRMGDKEPFNPVPPVFRYAFARYTTIFVGYSLLDYNLRLLFKTLRWNVDKARMPKTFAVDPYPDRLIRDVYDDRDRFVQFIVRDVWSFVPMLYREVTGREMS